MDDVLEQLEPIFFWIQTLNFKASRSKVIFPTKKI